MGRWQLSDQFIPCTGDVKDITPANGTDYQLGELQSFVNGYIEIVRLPDQGFYMIVNEEGLLHGLAYNPRASEIAGRPIIGSVAVIERFRLQ